MRDLTTAWNNPAYAGLTVFLCIRSGNYVTVPSNEPEKVRSMYDSVQAGDYEYLGEVPATITPDSPGGQETIDVP